MREYDNATGAQAAKAVGKPVSFDSYTPLRMSLSALHVAWSRGMGKISIWEPLNLPSIDTMAREIMHRE